MHCSALVVLAATIAGCGALHPGRDIAGKSVRYQVEFLGSPDDSMSHTAMTISYATNDGEQEQHNVGLPWTTLAGTANRGFTASVTAQFDGFGTIMCRIVIDDKVLEERASAQEPYPVVTCRS